jgi:ATP-dependent Clp protease ATP-binding subunit ClpC
MDKKLYSHELQDVLSYMVETLVNEFPTDIFTPEHLVTALLDIKKCHANMILDNCLMSSNIDELKNIYETFLREHSKPLVLLERKDKKNIEFDSELKQIMELAEKEKESLNSPQIGTEHILLSILNPLNPNNIQEVFKTVGLDYSFIYNKCLEDSKNRNNKNDKIKLKQLNHPNKANVILPLKNDISSKTNFIDLYTISLNKLAREGKVDTLIGREKELNQIVKVLARRKKNNVVLVGKGGCGKTAIVYGIADLIQKNEVPDILRNKEIVMLNIMALISGTHFRGMFEERVNGLFDELKASRNHILFIDDIQSVLKGSGKDKDTDISSMIGEILSEGDIRVIGTTNFKDYKNSIESNTSIARKLQKIIVEPTTIEESINILINNKKYYEEYHNVNYDDNVIKTCVELAEMYITDRSLPDSAFDIMDLSGAYTCLIDREPLHIIESRKRLLEIGKEKNMSLNNGDFSNIDKLTDEENNLKLALSDFERDYKKNIEQYRINITIDNINSTVSEMTNIPIHKLSSNEKEKIAHIDQILKESIIGQDEAVESVCRIIKRNKVGLGDKTKTLGNLLMLGPSGCGKTLIAKKLAEEIFGDEKALVRIDMSEYSEKNSVSKLMGAAPGYVGYENGGQLTEAIKNKQHCVLLLDEIEKADQEVYNLFLQLFDEGRLTDSSGQVVNFKNVIVLMTSNIGAKQASELGKGVGFITDENKNKKSIIEKQLKQQFTPEFINRIDQIVYFNSLNDDNLKDIVKLEINKFKKRLNNINYDIKWDDDVINFLHSKAIKQKEYGARPIIRLIQDNIEDQITDLMLQHDYKNNYIFNARYENEYVKIG